MKNISKIANEILKPFFAPTKQDLRSRLLSETKNWKFKPSIDSIDEASTFFNKEYIGDMDCATFIETIIERAVDLDFAEIIGMEQSENNQIILQDNFVKAYSYLKDKGKLPTNVIHAILKDQKTKQASMSRYCSFYKVKDRSWYMDLANEEYAGREDATTYGPFNSLAEAHNYLNNNFSNPGSYNEDETGNREIPKRSPNGDAVRRPKW